MTAVREQIITIHNDGSISGLEQAEKGGIDFKVLGDTDMNRTSEILWSKDKHKFYVRFIHQNCYLKDEKGQLVYFDSYKKAEQGEVAYLDALRLKGQIQLPQ